MSDEDRWSEPRRCTRLQILAGEMLPQWITGRGYVSGSLHQLDRRDRNEATFSTALFKAPHTKVTLQSLGRPLNVNTILVLEDEPAVLRLLRHMLKPNSLVEATSAEQALQRFIEHDRRIDLLVADVTLPISSGITVALLLRSGHPHLPVILTSGYPVSGWSSQDFADLQRLGSHSVMVLQKPFQAQALLAAVGELVGLAQPVKAKTA